VLGLDEPTAKRTELSGSPTVTARTQLKEQTGELQDLAEKSDKLFADAAAVVKAENSDAGWRRVGACRGG